LICFRKGKKEGGGKNRGWKKSEFFVSCETFFLSRRGGKSQPQLTSVPHGLKAAAIVERGGGVSGQ
jgi:hypothetical protein